jgi:hypothetical protein
VCVCVFVGVGVGVGVCDLYISKTRRSVPDLVCCATERERERIVTYGTESWSLTNKIKIVLMM